jgi:putative chitinase
MQAACDKFGVSSNAKRLAAFLANVGVESNGLTVFAENTNYSAKRLAEVWPYRYAISPQVDNKVPNDTAVRIAGNPVLVASNVYANRLGNGVEETRDGWNFRGQGPIQLTGKEQILKFFMAMGLPTDSDPAALQQPDLGSMSAAWFFSICGAFDFADQGNFDMTVKRVNGQLPCPANQGERRRTLYGDVLPLLQAAPAPVKTSPTTVKKPAAQSMPSAPSQEPPERP